MSGPRAGARQGAPQDPTAAACPDVVTGAVHALFAYDVAPEIDLDRAQTVLRSTERLTIRSPQRGLEYFAFRPTPVRIVVDAEALPLGPFRTDPTFDTVLYDFGAVSIGYRIPVAGPVEDLIALGHQLQESEVLQKDARERVESMARLLGMATPGEISPIAEDYYVHHLTAFASPVQPQDLVTRYRLPIARLLRAEPLPLSDQEAADALATRLAFGVDDLVILDWNAALLLGREVDDILTVLTFATVQLAELRFLDRELDEALERSYALVTRPLRLGPRLLRSHRGDRQAVARHQVDAAILFERVTNAVKVFGEEYLARVYRLAAVRFRLAEWDATIQRKLQTLESIYGKLADQAATRRMELVEWVIVVLILLSILVSLG